MPIEKVTASNDSIDILQDVDAVREIAAVTTMLDVVCRSTGMGFAAVSRVTKERWIACSVLDSIHFGLVPGSELRVESTICNEIRETRRAVIIDHVAEDPVFRNHHTPACYKFQSYVSVPIIRRDGSFFGTLCAIDPCPRRLNTPETVGMFQLFAELIGFYLDSAEREHISAAALQDARITAELREQFIAVLGHDLRNPLNAIQAGTQVLQRAPEKIAAVLPLFERSVRRMTALVDNILDFARGRLGGGLPLEYEIVNDLSQDLKQIVDELRAQGPDRAIIAHFDLRQPVRCDRMRVSQLFSNLLANALTYGDPAKPISVSATAHTDRFKLIVSNAGAPIPADTLTHLFQPFFRAVARRSAQGLGLGLFIVSEIARAHAGTIRVLSDDESTQFIFEMPLAPCA